MINVELFNVTSLLGLLDIILAIFLLATAIAPFVQRRTLENTATLLLAIQAIFVPFSLLTAGAIFFFQGWRLAPILQLAVLLLHLVISILTVKDFVVFGRH